MQLTDRYLEALDRVAAWQLREQALAHALSDEAALLSHMAPEDDIEFD
jgi:hypothetical protein